MTTESAKPKLWTPGDWNAYFGFGTNILVNLLVLTGLLRFVLKMPDHIVFGRILPATGLMMCLSTVYYAWLAYKLAKKTGRTDVCALPSGISVRNRASVSGDVSARTPSSRVTTIGSPRRCGTVTGTISSSNTPRSQAAAASRWLRTANSSDRCRPIPYRLAMFSAVSTMPEIGPNRQSGCDRSRPRSSRS